MDMNNMMNRDTNNADNMYNTGSYETQSQYTTYTGTTINSPIIEESKKGIGFVGALIGAIIGGIIWTIIGCFGFISGWIAVLIFFLAQFGYQKLAGKLDKFGVIVSLVLGLLIIIPATYASYGYLFYKDLNDAFSNRFTYWEVIADLPLYMERYESWGRFFGNLGLGFLFTGVAAIYVGASALKDKKLTGKNLRKK